MGKAGGMLLAALAALALAGPGGVVLAQDPGVDAVDFGVMNLNPGVNTMWKLTVSFVNFNPVVGYDIHLYFKDFSNTGIVITDVVDLGFAISFTPFSNAFSGNVAQGGTLNMLSPGMIQGPIFIPVNCNVTGEPGDALPNCDVAPQVPTFEILLTTPEPGIADDIIVGGPPPDFTETPIFAVSVTVVPPNASSIRAFDVDKSCGNVGVQEDLDTPTPVPTPTPAPAPAPTPQIISDPHFRGFNGQEFDFDGVPDMVYNLITERDESGTPAMVLNAKLSQAYTTGVSADSETMMVHNYRSKGTWVSQIGFMLGESKLQVTSEPQSEAASQGFIRFGSFVINDEPIAVTGDYSMNEFTEVAISNSRTFSRAHVSGNDVTMTIDVVGPPASWSIPDQDAEAYTHINIKFERILLQTMEGLIGETAVQSFPQDDLLPAGRNGEGILRHRAAEYQVETLFDSLHPSTK